MFKFISLLNPSSSAHNTVIGMGLFTGSPSSSVPNQGSTEGLGFFLTGNFGAASSVGSQSPGSWQAYWTAPNTSGIGNPPMQASSLIPFAMDTIYNFTLETVTIYGVNDVLFKWTAAVEDKVSGALTQVSTFQQRVVISISGGNQRNVGPIGFTTLVVNANAGSTATVSKGTLCFLNYQSLSIKI
jgi:hypothetical protein